MKICPPMKSYVMENTDTFSIFVTFQKWCPSTVALCVKGSKGKCEGVYGEGQVCKVCVREVRVSVRGECKMCKKSVRVVRCV